MWTLPVVAAASAFEVVDRAATTAIPAAASRAAARMSAIERTRTGKRWVGMGTLLGNVAGRQPAVDILESDARSRAGFG
jgi:hypothetical protein